MPKIKKVVEVATINPKQETETKISKDKRINLGETYGDESFQITTQKVNKEDTKEENHKQIKKEIEVLPIEKRHTKFSWNQYLLFFSILVFGILLGTIFSLTEVKYNTFKYQNLSNNQSLNQNLVSAKGNINQGSPSKPYPGFSIQNTQSNNKNSAVNNNTCAQPIKQSNDQLTEFNGGKYKVFQKANGGLIIAW